jgi:hypothetical protein
LWVASHIRHSLGRPLGSIRGKKSSVVGLPLSFGRLPLFAREGCDGWLFVVVGGRRPPSFLKKGSLDKKESIFHRSVVRAQTF